MRAFIEFNRLNELPHLNYSPRVGGDDSHLFKVEWEGI